MNNKKGFTMVELLVVLVIVAILAAVATPIYLANVQRSRASEAVGSMALIRQGLRDYQISGASYFNIGTGASTGAITDTLPTSVAANADPTPVGSGVNIEAGVAQYFGNTAFTVDSNPAATEDGVSNLFANPPVVDFLITATGSDSNLASAIPVLGENNQCVGTVTDCATKVGEVTNYVLEMDNSGRVFVTYDITAATPVWEAY